MKYADILFYEQKKRQKKEEDAVAEQKNGLEDYFVTKGNKKLR